MQASGFSAAFLALSAAIAARGAEPPVPDCAGIPAVNLQLLRREAGEISVQIQLEAKDGDKQLNQKKGLFRQNGRFQLVQKVHLPCLRQSKLCQLHLTELTLDPFWVCGFFEGFSFNLKGHHQSVHNQTTPKSQCINL